MIVRSLARRVAARAPRFRHRGQRRRVHNVGRGPVVLRQLQRSGAEDDLEVEALLDASGDRARR